MFKGDEEEEEEAEECFSFYFGVYLSFDEVICYVCLEERMESECVCV